MNDFRVVGSLARRGKEGDCPDALKNSSRKKMSPLGGIFVATHPSGQPITTRSQNRHYANRTKYIGQPIDAPLGELEIWVE